MSDIIVRSADISLAVSDISLSGADIQGEVSDIGEWFIDVKRKVYVGVLNS